MRTEVSPGITATIQLDTESHGTHAPPFNQFRTEQMVTDIGRIAKNRVEATSELSCIESK